jgi:hypothetical protein
VPRQYDASPPPGCLYLPDAAERLRLTVSTLRRYRVEGGGPESRLHGGLVCYEIADLDRWAAEKAKESTRGGVDPAPQTGDSRPPEMRRGRRTRPRRAGAA